MDDFAYEMESAEAPRVYTVTQLNRDVRCWLENHYANIWVEGEISNLKLHSSGHIYLSLKDESSQISAVFFSRYNQRLKFRIKDGLKVQVRGKLSLYDARGQYQFYIEAMEPQGLGSLQLAFIQLKEKLGAEGLFDPSHKKPLPALPRTVGVVTSPTGAAIRDILNVLERRFCGLRVLIYPVRVQGDGAAAEIAQAIAEMNRIAEVDVMIVGRGGGSLEDLWAFNEEVVARAIHQSQIPVISAVGHEIDWTISDWVADLRAPTPSAAAELVVQSREELQGRIEGLKYRLKSRIELWLEQKKGVLESLAGSYALKQPEYLVQQCAQRLDELLRHLETKAQICLSDAEAAYRTAAGKLHVLSPLSVLGRGYTVTRREYGGLVKSVLDLKTGEILNTRFADGVCISKVVKTEQSDG